MCDKINVNSTEYEHYSRKKFTVRLTNEIILDRSEVSYDNKGNRKYSKDKGVKYKKAEAYFNSTYLTNNKNCLIFKECYSVFADYYQMFRGENSWGQSKGHEAHMMIKTLPLTFENFECKNKLRLDSNRYNSFEVSYKCLNCVAELNSNSSKYSYGSVLVEKGKMPKQCVLFFDKQIIYFELIMFDFTDWKPKIDDKKDALNPYSNSQELFDKIDIPPLINFIVDKFIFIDDFCNIHKIAFYPCNVAQNN
jgi:hypothetical protein